jgi:hypothetical protein
MDMLVRGRGASYNMRSIDEKINRKRSELEAICGEPWPVKRRRSIQEKKPRINDNRLMMRIMLPQMKQAGCYLTERERMKQVAHGGPLSERRSQARSLFIVVVVRVLGTTSVQEVTGRQGGCLDEHFAPGLPMPSQTGNPVSQDPVPPVGDCLVVSTSYMRETPH